MVRHFLIILATISIAFFVLFFSIIQTAQVKYSFGPSATSTDEKILGDNVKVDYYFPYPGTILPDHPLWGLKALRDHVWLVLTAKPERKAELNLLFANKRIVASKILFEADKPELAYSVLTKSEKYLESALSEEEIARSRSVDTKAFLMSLNLAVLKHREELGEIMTMAPDDAKPEIVKVEDKLIELYQKTRNLLLDQGMSPPTNPFELRSS